MCPSERSTKGKELRFLFYSHDGFGVGHTRRNLAIAAAMVDQCPQASVLVASSTDDAHRLGLPERVDVLKLPALCKIGNDEYRGRRLRLPTGQIHGLRGCLLEAAVNSFRPALLLVDKHPFGVCGELRLALEAAKSAGGRAVLGLRDILDDPVIVRREWAERHYDRAIEGLYDRVLVYGQRVVFDPIEQYALPGGVSERIRFCGYVVNRDDDVSTDAWPLALHTPSRSRPVVLATTGGGEDGFALLENFIQASAVAPWHGIVVAGPMTPPDHLGILRDRAAAAQVDFLDFIPRLPAAFDSIDALVCMGGYNTLTEAAAYGVPTVCVPRVTPRTEQLIRAQAFERLGLLRAIHPKELNPATLSAAVQAALATGRRELRARVQAALTFEGARLAAEELLALAATAHAEPTSLKAVSL
jgi:predicted glycosyltransferase